MAHSKVGARYWLALLWLCQSIKNMFHSIPEDLDASAFFWHISFYLEPSPTGMIVRAQIGAGMRHLSKDSSS
jgi:hypothetical protein